MQPDEIVEQNETVPEVPVPSLVRAPVHVAATEEQLGEALRSNKPIDISSAVDEFRKNPPPAPEIYTLTIEERLMFAKIQAKMEALNNQATGAVLLLVEQRKLQGDWALEQPGFARLIKQK